MRFSKILGATSFKRLKHLCLDHPPAGETPRYVSEQLWNNMKPIFKPGKNIAIKVPPHEYEQTVAFYKDVLGLVLKEASSPDNFESITFEFGDKNLWIDKISGISQAEIWLEIETDNINEAEAYLEAMGCARRDEIEPLPSDFKGFWISSPSNIIHLVNHKHT
ncbi:hypothetical protein D1AOALGA4SA_8042 [Olavius algarvensis Delta 1 endosymbiont]|nr:hypothetical protein D1AOALGA4SA_8042 [Olavius algarvensis Delta 1 endosymbiont]